MTAMHPATSVSTTMAHHTLPTASGPPAPAAAQRFLRFVDASPTPFHATATAVAMLEQAGFKRLKEQQVWDGLVEKGGKYL